jgi:AraC-like DNA-binding protein
VSAGRPPARWLLPATLATTAAAATAAATTAVATAAAAATRTATAARTTTAAAAAVEWGFWHFGEFSRAYKECFGELPSETLRRRDY